MQGPAAINGFEVKVTKLNENVFVVDGLISADEVAAFNIIHNQASGRGTLFVSLYNNSNITTIPTIRRLRITWSFPRPCVFPMVTKPAAAFAPAT